MTTCIHKSNIIQVALATPVGDFFDYLSCDELPKIGARVQVPFGKNNRQLIGIVIKINNTSNFDLSTLKYINTIIDNKPIISNKTIQLAQWLSSYYHYPLGETLSVMLPTLLKQGKTLSKTNYYKLINNDNTTIEQQLKQAKKLKEHFKKIQDFLSKNAVDFISENELTNLEIKKPSINKLLEKKLIQLHTDDDFNYTKPKLATLRNSPPPLTQEQQSAHRQICQAIDQNHYRGFLLNGVTGSGKTENYLNALWHCLQKGRQALVLVPEIGLTPQTYGRFRERFNANILILHSNLNNTERLAGWQACKNGVAQIIIATRSALFYEFANLGLIVIDECHDHSYKQQDHLRYNATDVALYIGLKQQIPVVLGSATPSLEQLFLVDQGKLTELTLTHRAANAKPPRFELIDKRLHPHTSPIDERTTAFATPTIYAISEHLKRGEQVLVFLNRRGYAPILLCNACGWQANCIRCSSHLTYHKSKGFLSCHHCGYQVRRPHTCPDCHSVNLDTLGVGTAQIFEQLHALFANPQTIATPYPIVQIDKDTTSKKSDWERLYRAINENRPMILVGTQMLAKGHHFDKVTLVVIVDADTGFLSTNFRSPEHTAQTIVQVAGRAGRGDLAGRVLIQTVQPDNKLLLELIQDGYLSFAHSLLKERQMLGLPPYTYAALIESKSSNQGLAKAAIITIKNHLPKTHPFAILAPIEPPMNKKNNQFFCQMLILSKNRKELHVFLQEFLPFIKGLNDIKKVKLTIDIDPIGW